MTNEETKNNSEFLNTTQKYEKVFEKIEKYSKLRGENKVSEPGLDDGFALPEGSDFSFDTDVQTKKEFVFADGGELEAPTLEEMKSDFQNLAELALELQEGGMVMPSALWTPLMLLSESYLGSFVAPEDQVKKWEIFKPVYDAFKKHEVYLKSEDVGIIGESVDAWLGSIDPKMVKNMQ